MRNGYWLALLLIVSLVVVASWLKPWQSWLPIRHVRVQGVFAHIDRVEVEQALMPAVTCSFLGLNMAQVETLALSLPWVRAVQVRRVWPDTVDIRLYEQVPVARWHDRALVNESGQQFVPELLEHFRHLPLLIAPKSRAERSVETLLEVQGQLADHGMLLKELQISASRSWQIKTSDGIEITLGTREPELSLKRFLMASALFSPEQLGAMSRIDMRYPNGFAVAWRPDAPVFDWRKIAARH